ncbi:MAG TPA: YihY/virulence factor BrkB family protein [Rhizomicrobium sp.]|jgi:membrane protein|nr:YihY/virulence factor BrkB family protein [Rhizomicrobium sp.]
MFKQVWQLFRAGIDAFVEDEALTRGAAIAFYIVTAIAPLLYICVTIAGLVMGRAEARAAVDAVLGQIMSKDSVGIFALAIRNAAGTSTGIVGGIVGVATLVLTASGVFGEMEDALNAIWRAPPKGALLPRLLRGRARSLGLVMGLGVLLVISMLIGGAISAFQHTIAVETALSRATLAVLHGAVSYLLAAVLFAAIYKTLPNKDLEWRDVIAGALGTALLFLFGQILLGWFLGSSMIARPYGAAGGMILLLLWVYYSAQVFLLGAEFTKVYACHFGSQQGCDGLEGTAHIGSERAAAPSGSQA